MGNEKMTLDIETSNVSSYTVDLKDISEELNNPTQATREITQRYQLDLDRINGDTFDDIETNNTYIQENIGEIISNNISIGKLITQLKGTTQEDIEDFLSKIPEDELNKLLGNAGLPDLDTLEELLDHIKLTGKKAKDFKKKIKELKQGGKDKFEILKNTYNSNDTIDENLKNIRGPLKELQKFVHSINKLKLKKEGEGIFLNIKKDLNDLKKIRANLPKYTPVQYTQMFDNYIEAGEIMVGDIKDFKQKDLPGYEKQFDAGVRLLDKANKYVNLAYKSSVFLQQNGLSFEGFKNTYSSEKTQDENVDAVTDYVKSNLSTSAKVKLLQELTKVANGDYDETLRDIFKEGKGDISEIEQDLGILTGDSKYLQKLFVEKGILEQGETIKSKFNGDFDINKILEQRDNLLTDDIFKNAKTAGAIQLLAKKMGLKAVLLTDTGIETTTTGIELEDGSYIIVDPSDGSIILAPNKIMAKAQKDDKDGNVKLYTIVADVKLGKDERGEFKPDIKIVKKFRTSLQKKLAKTISATGELTATDSVLNESEYKLGTNISGNVGTNGDGNMKVDYYSKHIHLGTEVKKFHIGKTEIQAVLADLGVKIGDKKTFGEIKLDAKGGYIIVNQNGKQTKLATASIYAQYTKRFGNDTSYIDFVSALQVSGTMKTSFDGDINNALGNFDLEGSGVFGLKGNLELYKNEKDYLSIYGHFLKGYDLGVNPNVQPGETDLSNIVDFYSSTSFGIGTKWQIGKGFGELDYSYKSSIYGNMQKFHGMLGYNLDNGGAISASGNYKITDKDKQWLIKLMASNGEKGKEGTTEVTASYSKKTKIEDPKYAKFITRVGITHNFTNTLKVNIYGQNTNNNGEHTKQIGAGVKWEF